MATESWTRRNRERCKKIWKDRRSDFLSILVLIRELVCCLEFSYSFDTARNRSNYCAVELLWESQIEMVALIFRISAYFAFLFRFIRKMKRAMRSFTLPGSTHNQTSLLAISNSHLMFTSCRLNWTMKSRKWSEPKKQRVDAPRVQAMSAAMTAMMMRDPLADWVRARAQLSLDPMLAEEEFRMKNSTCKLTIHWS